MKTKQLEFQNTELAEDHNELEEWDRQLEKAHRKLVRNPGQLESAQAR